MASTSAEPVNQAQPCQLVVSTASPYLVLAASDSFCEMSGYAEAEILGQPSTFLNGQGTCADTAASLVSHLQERRPVVVRMFGYTKDGSTFLADIEARPLPETLAPEIARRAGIPCALLEYSRFSRQHLAAATLGEGPPTALSAEGPVDLEVAPYAGAACVAVSSSQPWRIVAANQAWATLTGYATDETVGASPALLQGRLTDGSALGALREACARSTPIAVRLMCHGKSGAPFVAAVNVVPERGMVVVIVRPEQPTAYAPSASGAAAESSTNELLAKRFKTVSNGHGGSFCSTHSTSPTHDCRSLASGSTEGSTEDAGSDGKSDVAADAEALQGLSRAAAAEEARDIEASSAACARADATGGGSAAPRVAEGRLAGLELARCDSTMSDGGVGLARCDSTLSDGGGASGGRDFANKPAPFLSKLLQIVETEEYEPIVRWVGADTPSPSFVIVDTVAFSKQVLPQFFKHNKLSSFVQQLYTYGFRRCSEQLPPRRAKAGATGGAIAVGAAPDLSDSHTVAFTHELFRPGAPELLLQIKRGGVLKAEVREPASPTAAPVAVASASRDAEESRQLLALSGEVSMLEASVEYLARSQRERSATDGQWIDSMTRLVQGRLLEQQAQLAPVPRVERPAPPPAAAPAPSCASRAAAAAMLAPEDAGAGVNALCRAVEAQESRGRDGLDARKVEGKGEGSGEGSSPPHSDNSDHSVSEGNSVEV